MLIVVRNTLFAPFVSRTCIEQKEVKWSKELIDEVTSATTPLEDLCWPCGYAFGCFPKKTEQERRDQFTSKDRFRMQIKNISKAAPEILIDLVQDKIFHRHSHRSLDKPENKFAFVQSETLQSKFDLSKEEVASKFPIFPMRSVECMTDKGIIMNISDVPQRSKLARRKFHQGIFGRALSQVGPANTIANHPANAPSTPRQSSHQLHDLIGRSKDAFFANTPANPAWPVSRLSQ